MDLVTIKFRNGRTLQWAIDCEICILTRDNRRNWVGVPDVAPGTIVHGLGLVIEVDCPRRGKLVMPARDPESLPRHRFVRPSSEGALLTVEDTPPV